MLIIRSHNGVAVRLTEERWRHIIQRHPEMVEQRQPVFETVTDPDLIQDGDYGVLLATRLFPKTPLTKKYLVVVYRELGPEDGFIVTAYFTSRPSHERVTIWKR